MLQTPNPSSQNQSTQGLSRPLVRHARREQWGRALMLWERENKRGYQFEDGEMRVFARPYFGLLQPAQNPDPVLRHQLRERALTDGHIEAPPPKKGERQAPGRPLPNVEDQTTVFESQFPEGFFGDSWTDRFRGAPGGRRLKRHRDAAIERAAALLGQEALQACIDSGRPAEVLGRMLEVIGETDLATRKQLDAFRTLECDVELAQALHGFLHNVRFGDLATMARLRRVLARQGLRKIPWTSLTAPRALLYPKDHMCVRPSVVRAQAKLIAPRMKISQVPSASEYSQCLELVMAVREHLTRAGFSPRDLFDVTEFMRTTLSGPSKTALVSAMVDRRGKESAEKAAAAPRGLQRTPVMQ